MKISESNQKLLEKLFEKSGQNITSDNFNVLLKNWCLNQLDKMEEKVK